MSEASNDKLALAVGSKYALVIAVAKRAKQLRDGSPKLVDSKSKNPITVALEEIAQGVVKVRTPTQEEIETSERMESVPKTSAAREAVELLMAAEREAAAAQKTAKPVATAEAEPEINLSHDDDEEEDLAESLEDTDDLDESDETDETDEEEASDEDSSPEE